MNTNEGVMIDFNEVESNDLTIGEKWVLHNISEYTNGGDYCNLGDGRFSGSTNMLALGLKYRGLSGHIWTVDLYPKARFTPEIINKQSIKWGVEDYITRCKGSTFEYGEKHWVDKRFDFVFIDANHSFKFVKRDAMNFMKLSNLIGFHDTNMESVDRALTESGIVNWKLLYRVDTIKVFENNIDLF